MVQEEGKNKLICKNRKCSVVLDRNLIVCQAKERSYDYILAIKFVELILRNACSYVFLWCVE